jgi:hypothetical protein
VKKAEGRRQRAERKRQKAEGRKKKPKAPPTPPAGEFVGQGRKLKAEGENR